MRVDLFDPENEDWLPPSSFPDLTGCDRIAIDLETKDPNLTMLGPGWCRDDGYLCQRPDHLWFLYNYEYDQDH